MRIRLALSASVAALALLASGCGGSDGGSTSSSDTTPTEEWASSLCTAITAWTDSLRSSVEEIQSGNISREALEGAADDAKASTETLIDDLNGLGKPDTEAGDQAQETLTQLTDELQQDVDEIESALNDSSANILTTVSTIVSTLTKMGSQFSDAFTELGNLDTQGELEDAFNEADSCQEIVG